MLDRISQLYTEWKSLQPLKPEDQRRLDEKFRLEFNYNSNHIEGNTLTYGQTKLLLIFGTTEGVHELREYEEMKAHDVALKMIIEEAQDKERPLTENFIRTLNETILVRPFWKDAQTPDGQSTRMEVKVGEYKSRPNHVRTATDDIFHYASVEETPVMMKDLVNWYNAEIIKAELTPLEIASLLHYRYIRIHPFEDGNGRVARLLVNYVLFRYEYPMVIIQTKDKNNYLRTLNRCDVEVGLEPSQGVNASIGKIQPFIEYIGEQLVHSFDISIKAGKGESIEEEDDFEKQLTLLQRKLKRSEIERPSFNKEYYKEIMEQVYYPLAEKINESLILINKFFRKNEIFGGFSLKGDNGGYLRINPLVRDNDGYNSDHINSVSEVFFQYNSSNSLNPKLKNLSIEIKVKITFKVDEYLIDCISSRKYNYGQYPTLEDLDGIIGQYKQEVLNKLDNAIK